MIWTALKESGLKCANCGEGNPGLGDYTEQLLSSIGVTKDRYRAAKELFGLAPTCNCESRQQWLNTVGAWLGL